MNAACLIEESTGGKSRVVSAMVVHEDMATGLSANKFLERLLGHGADGAGCEKNFWTLNLLQTPLFQEQAAAEAGQAVVIILSLVRKTGLPEVVQEWLSRWLDYREDRPYAFGILLDGKLAQASEKNAVLDCVEKFAGQRMKQR